MKLQSSETITMPNVSYSGCDMVASINMPMPGNKTVTQVIGSLQTITYSIYMDKKPIRSLGNINPKDYVFGPRTIAGSLVFAVFNKHLVKHLLDETKLHSTEYNLLADELPPFDITISFANEYGYKSRLAIYGVRIVTEGQTMSVNDVYTENTYQFVATNIDYLEDINQKVPMAYSSQNTKNKATKSNKKEKLKSKDIEKYNNNCDFQYQKISNNTIMISFDCPTHDKELVIYQIVDNHTDVLYSIRLHGQKQQDIVFYEKGKYGVRLISNDASQTAVKYITI